MPNKKQPTAKLFGFLLWGASGTCIINHTKPASSSCVLGLTRQNSAVSGKKNILSKIEIVALQCDFNVKVVQHEKETFSTEAVVVRVRVL